MSEVSETNQSNLTEKPVKSGENKVRDKNGKWVKGVSGNPNGKIVGTKNFDTLFWEAVKKIGTEGKDIEFFRDVDKELIKKALIEARKKDATIAGELAADLLPRLNRQYTLAVGKPTIRYFEGEEGIHDVFMDIYSPKKEPVWGCVDLEVAGKAFPEHITKTLIPLRVKHNVFANSLVADSPAGRAIQSEDSKHLRKTVLVNKKTHPLPAEIDVYEDKIAMLSFEKGKFVGILIQNQAFATTLKSVFSLTFAPLHQKNHTTSVLQKSPVPQPSETPG